MYFFIFLYNDWYMFRQNNAILRDLVFYAINLSAYIDHNFTFYREYNRSYVYTATTRSRTAVTYCDVYFYTYLYCHRSYIYLLYDFSVFRLVSKHIDAEVAQKGT
jgi:hypothetical protein